MWAVSCCVAWSFLTSDIALVIVCGPLYRCKWLSYEHFQSLDEDSYGGSIICKVASVSLCFKLVDVCGKGFFFSLLYLHKAR